MSKLFSLSLLVLLAKIVWATPLDDLQKSGADAFHSHTQKIERRWLEALQRGDPRQDEYRIVFNKTIERYLDFFADDPRLVQVLLRAATINHSVGQSVNAVKLWHKILVLATASQTARAKALRGLFSVYLANNNYVEVIDIANDFLYQRQPSPSLGNELLGVLSRAVIRQGQRLLKIGRANEAAELLWQHYHNRQLPHRAQILRDSGYYYAMANNWHRARAVAKLYLREKYPNDQAQILYLLAKAHDGLQENRQAISNYLALYKKYPDNDLAQHAFDRLVAIATSDRDYFTLAKVFMWAGDRQQVTTNKTDRYLQAFDNALQARELRLAKHVLRKIEQTVANPTMRIKMLVSKSKMDYARDKFKSSAAKLRHALELSKTIINSNQRNTIQQEIHALLRQVRTAKPKHLRSANLFRTLYKSDLH